MQFALTKPCKDCPFTIDTTMVLRRGRMAGIAKDLRNDYTVFPCHKTTVHDEDGGTVPHDREQACMGALAFTLREYGMLPVMARIACLRHDLKLDDVRANFDVVVKPGSWRYTR